MKFLIIGDLHGRIPRIRFKDYEAIIAPGDYSSDELKTFAFKQVEYAKKGLKVLSYEELLGKKRYNKILRNMFCKGRKVLEFLNKKCDIYGIPGNWDKGNSKFNYTKLIRNLKNYHNCHMRVVDAKEVVIIGYGYVNGVELLNYRGYSGMSMADYKKSYRRYNKIKNKFDELFKKAKEKNKPIIFLCHTMPFNTKFDKITLRESPQYGKHFGSLIARRMILKHKPLLYVGAHMHEYFGKTRLGNTLIIAAGYGRNKNILVDIVHGKIRSFKFKS